MDTPKEISENLLAALEAAEQIHRFNYWVASGESHYALHKLYLHIAEPIDEQLNELGNRIVTLIKEPSQRRITYMTKKYIKELKSKNSLEKSLEIEKIVIELTKQLYDTLKDGKMLTLGFDELLMGISNQHEDAIYHLTRTAK